MLSVELGWSMWVLSMSVASTNLTLNMSPVKTSQLNCAPTGILQASSFYIPKFLWAVHVVITSKRKMELCSMEKKQLMPK